MAEQPAPGSIFRRAAVERLASPDRLDVLADVVTPQSRLAIGTLLVCAAGTLIWGFVGTIPTKLYAPCMITHAGGVLEVPAGSRGRVVEFRVREGDHVRVGDVIARIEQPELQEAVAAAVQRVTELEAHAGSSPAAGSAALQAELKEARRRLTELRALAEQRSLVRSAHAGRVLELRGGGLGAQVDVGTPLLTLEPEGEGSGRGLEVVIFTPPGEGKNVRAGMDVQVSPANVRREESGFLVGKVRWVADYPSSQQGIMRVLQNERLAEQFSAGGAPIKVLADLVPDPAAPDGYRWSSGRGPRNPVDSGTLCEAGITLERRAPITLVLPLLRRTFGRD